MWIESESGNLINSDRIGEIGIVGPYEIEGCERPCYDLYAFHVGDVEHFHGPFHGKVFRDAHRYLVQHTSYEDCEGLLKRLKETLRNGAPYFSTRAVLDWLRARRRPKAAVGPNGSTTTTRRATS